MSIAQDELKLLFAEAERRGDRDTAIAIMDRLENIGPEEKERGFIENIEDRYNQRKLEVSDTIEDLIEGNITKGEGAVQLIGKGVAGPVFDVVGEGIVSLGKSAFSILPDWLQEDVKESAIDGWNAISDTEIGQQAIEAVKGGAKKWGEFKENNPRAAKNIESTVNIAALISPVKVKKNMEPTIVGRTSDLIEEKAKQQIAKNRSDFIGDLISPKKTPKVRIDEVARTKEVGKGPLKRNIISLSSKEKEVANVITNIKGVSHKNTLQRNYNIIADENLKQAKMLERSLAARKIQVNRKEAFGKIDSKIDDIVATNPLIVGNAETTARRASDMAKRLIDESDGTAAGMLRARRKFDNWVIRQKGEKAFSSDVDNALTISVREIRRTMNDLADDAVKRYGQRKGGMRSEGIRRSLNNQSKMFDALENIAPKAAEEHALAIGRAWQNATKLLPFKEKATRELALLFGIGGLGASAVFAPFITGTLGIGGTLYGSYKLIMSPQMKQGIAKLLKMTDAAIRTSTNPNMIKQLRADKALILEALKAAEE